MYVIAVGVRTSTAQQASQLLALCTRKKSRHKFYSLLQDLQGMLQY
jgi:hypothetical protein